MKSRSNPKCHFRQTVASSSARKCICISYFGMFACFSYPGWLSIWIQRSLADWSWPEKNAVPRGKPEGNLLYCFCAKRVVWITRDFQFVHYFHWPWLKAHFWVNGFIIFVPPRPVGLPNTFVSRPPYSSGGRLKLRMFDLGLDWFEWYNNHYYWAVDAMNECVNEAQTNDVLSPPANLIIISTCTLY